MACAHLTYRRGKKEDYESQVAALRRALRAERTDPDGRIEHPTFEKPAPKTEWGSGKYWIRSSPGGEIYFDAASTEQAIQISHLIASSARPAASAGLSILGDAMKAKYGVNPVDRDGASFELGYGDDTIGSL